uniref:hypothetical protein n=1 Tax=Bacillus pumilus TaxID=1408 RepID=UPI001C92C8B4
KPLIRLHSKSFDGDGGSLLDRFVILIKIVESVDSSTFSVLFLQEIKTMILSFCSQIVAMMLP